MNYFQQLLDSLDRAKDRVGVSRTGAWYRGQSHTWDLAPSLFRHYQENKITPETPVDPREDGFFMEFLFRSPELSLKNISSWELLALMQHYGTPTRLMDWTENLLVALYFAISRSVENLPSVPGRQPCIFGANPYKLTRAAIETAAMDAPLVRRNDGLRLIEVTAHPKLDYAATFISDSKWWYNSPLPIASPWQNSRLHAQQGFFTVHGKDQLPLNHQIGVSKYVKRVDISSEAIPEIMRVLKDANMNHYTLFRDYESLSAMLRVKFGSSKRSEVTGSQS